MKNTPPHLFLLAACLLTTTAWGDSQRLPIYPVQIQFEENPPWLHAYIHVNAIYWREKILRQTPPAAHWPDPLRQSVQAYINQHFSLFADDHQLYGTVIDCHYTPEPWKPNEQGHLAFNVLYRFPKDVRTIHGQATFYSEYWPPPEGTTAALSQYLTLLVIAGHMGLAVPIQSPAYSITLQQDIPTPWWTALARSASELLHRCRSVTLDWLRRI